MRKLSLAICLLCAPGIALAQSLQEWQQQQNTENQILLKSKCNGMSEEAPSALSYLQGYAQKAKATPDQVVQANYLGMDDLFPNEEMEAVLLALDSGHASNQSDLKTFIQNLCLNNSGNQ